MKKKLNILPENPQEGVGRFPKWLHRKLPTGSNLWKTEEILTEKRLATVCEEAKCPNRFECWSKKTATFLVMGKSCTRNCGFCDIDFSKNPMALEPDEPERLADSVKALGLRHVVITMVARDDLTDGGAAHLVSIIQAVRKSNKGVSIEVLTSDFSGNEEALLAVLEEGPEIFNHNIETVRSLTPRVRHKATYERTLSVLRLARTRGKKSFVKSGMMVGLGEREEEVQETIADLKEAGCHIITIGHYLQPNPYKLRVKDFVNPEQFEAYAAFGRKIGVEHIYSGPFVRSSYNAETLFNNLRNE